MDVFGPNGQDKMPACVIGEELAVRGQVHDTVIRAIAGDDPHGPEAGIHGEFVQRAEVVRLLLAAE